MTRLAPPVKLSEGQQQVLEEISRSRQMPHAVVQRACIVLQAARGKKNQEISLALGLDEDAVGLWRRRWLAGQEAVSQQEGRDKRLRAAIEGLLSDIPRPGCPPTFTAEQVCQVLALACTTPPVPLTHWTQEELAREAVKREIVDTISARSIGRFLKSGATQAAPDKTVAQSCGGRRSGISGGRQSRVQTLSPGRRTPCSGGASGEHG
jgi:putative transposase